MIRKPMKRTHRAPNRSMMGPTPSATRPPVNVPMATAPAMIERFQPNSSPMGLTKTPMVGLMMIAEAMADSTVIQTMTQP